MWGKEQSRCYCQAPRACARHTFAQWVAIVPISRPDTMALTSTDDSASIFKDGKLKPEIYKIRNIVGQTYVDIREHAGELCCRPAAVLEGNGLVGSRPHTTLIAVFMITSVGNSPLWSRLYHPQGAVSSLFSLCRVGLNRGMQPEPGKPDQFCIMLVGLGNESVVSIASFPVPWRMEIVRDERYRGCEYVR